MDRRVRNETINSKRTVECGNLCGWGMGKKKESNVLVALVRRKTEPLDVPESFKHHGEISVIEVGDVVALPKNKTL